MNHGESMIASGFSRFFLQHIEGISTTLKVAALAAGYAAFVWLTMYQVEHGFSALPRFLTLESSARPNAPEASSAAATTASSGSQPATSLGLTRVGGIASGASRPLESR